MLPTVLDCCLIQRKAINHEATQLSKDHNKSINQSLNTLPVTHNACISPHLTFTCTHRTTTDHQPLHCTDTHSCNTTCGAVDLSPAFAVATKAVELSARPSTMLPATAAKWSGPTSPICTSACSQLGSQRQGHRSRAQVTSLCHCERKVLGLLGVRPAAKTSRQLQSVISAAADSKTALDSEFPIRISFVKLASLSTYCLGC